MAEDVLIEMLGRFRRRSPRTMRSALELIAGEARDAFAADACALLLPAERAVYLAGEIRNAGERGIASAVGEPAAASWTWRCLDGEPGGGAGPVAALREPFHVGAEPAGSFALLRDGETFDAAARRGAAGFAEAVSVLLGQVIRGDGGETNGSTRLELLDAIGDPPMMRGVLDQIAGESGAEFCAFFAGSADRRLSARILCRELSSHLPEIRRKLLTAYGMFANDERADLAAEDVSFRSEEGNVAYLLGQSRIESYFLVPVVFDGVVRGVLYVGSVRRDAFVRENIAALRSLAEEDGRRTPIRYSVGGEAETLRRIVSAIPVGIALAGSDGEIVARNDMFCGVLRLPDGACGPIDDTFGRAGFSVSLPAGGEAVSGLVVRGGRGNERYLQIDRAPLGDLSPEVACVVVARDVTAERTSARRREESAAMTAHELRTPLAALRGALAIMREAGDGTPPAGRFLDTAIRTVDRLDLLVDGIVDASGVRDGNGKAQPERVDAGRFLEETVRLFEPTIRRRGIDLGILAGEGEQAARVDRAAVQQIVQNLLSNSLRHVPGGGRIELDVRPVDLAGPASGWRADARRLLADLPWERTASRPSFLDLVVRDTGDGVPASVADAVNGGTRRGDRPVGGLGLVIAGGLAVRHDGVLVLERLSAGGTAAHLVLPADDETAAAVSASRRAGAVLGDMAERGRRPVLYALEKNDRRCWLELAAGWRGRVVVEPASSEIDDESLSVWLFDESFAVALSAADRLVSSPLSFLEGGRGELRLLDGGPEDALRVEWAIVSDPETRLPAAIAAARKRTAATVTVAAEKGEPA